MLHKSKVASSKTTSVSLPAPRYLGSKATLQPAQSFRSRGNLHHIMQTFLSSLFNFVPLLLSTTLLLLYHLLRHALLRPRCPTPPRTIGFLHPHPLSGGGGERVLWSSLIAIHTLYPNAQLILYSAWTHSSIPLSTAVQIAKSTIRNQFGLDQPSLAFTPVDLPHASLADAKLYPHLTLLLQATGMLQLGWRAYRAHPVDMWIDTANMTFACVIPQLCGARTVSYVHYPIISTDMVRTVRLRKAQFNNSVRIAGSAWKSRMKLGYYRIFAWLYWCASRFVDVGVANSSWTRGHLVQLWNRRDVKVVFPPCAEMKLEEREVEREEGLIVSVGQFRPEKRHEMQVEIMKRLVEKGIAVRLVMIGGVRNEEDRERAERVRGMVSEEGLPVEVMVNAGLEELRGWLRRGVVGLHTMEDEHFGISVVELQRFGLVVVGHRSGGVALDIVEDKVNGYLAGDLDEYVEQIGRVVEMRTEERKEVSRKGMESGKRFSDAQFRQQFMQMLGETLGNN